MSNHWFYIQQWQKKSYEKLKKHRTVRVSWEALEGDRDQRETLPRFVKIPDHIELSNRAIRNYLSDIYGYTVYDWSVSQRQEDEARV